MTIAAAAAGGVGLLALAAWRPALALTLLAGLIPLTAGIGRGELIPLLRVNEALLLVVAAGWMTGELARRRAVAFNGLDVAVLAFCTGGALIPAGVILLTRAGADQSDWMTVVGPLQYLLVFVLYSRTELAGDGVRLLLNAVMLASVPVALIAVAELLNVGGVRELVGSYYPAQPRPSWDIVYRPASLLGHYSAVGAFGLLNFLLALALAATRQRGFPWWWLTFVMGVNLVGSVASNTYAPLLALPLGAAMVLLVARRVPWRHLAFAPFALGACAVLLWPAIERRLTVQLAAGGGRPFFVPESMQTRFDYWQGFFVPALARHGLWWGTGTLIPSEVPRPLTQFVDNGYLWQMFRAGLPGLALYIALLGAVAAAAWATRALGDDIRRAIGAACLGAVACVVVLDMTSEYLTFTAVTQEFWILVGLLGGLALAARPAPARFVLVREEAEPALPAWLTAAAASALRIAPDRALVRSSLAVVVGFGLARVLGFLFQVTSGRLLAPADYGRLTYALAVASVVSVLLTTAPLGLSRFLSRHDGHDLEQTAYYTNWLAVVGLVLAASLAVTVAIASPAGLGGWLLVGLVANLLGVAALETYREVQRGLGRYTLQSVFYVLANAIQLAAVLTAALLGARSPALFLTIYGLSAVAALLVLAPVGGLGVGLSVAALRWRRMLGIGSFIRPVLLQAVFWNLWANGDLILVQRLLTTTATGHYGAAKAIANGFALIPTAISFVFAPRVARLAEGEIRGQLARALGLAAAVTLPLVVAVALFARPLTGAVFGGRYESAAAPLVVLSVGMGLYGLKSVLGGLWLGIGYPVVETVASAAAMLATLGVGLALIPSRGLVGAAAAFSAGGAAQLVVAGAVTLWAFGARTPRVHQLGDQRILGAAPAARPAPAGRADGILLVAEELDLVQDEGYTKFTRVVESELGRRRSLVVHITRAHPWSRFGPLRMLLRTLEVVRAARRPELRERPAGVAVYVSRSSVTPAALLRARLLRMRLRAPVAIVALQAGAGALRGRFARWLAPDLLLLPTEAACREARRLGLNALCVWSGVDLDRFRPARPAEKAALRRERGLPVDRRVILHVGHLKEGRGLRALLPLAAAEGVTVLVVASGRRGPDSEALQSDLERRGVVVLAGYQAHVEELYRLADCYVFPTRLEDSAVALPLSVLEALASGLPVVSTRFGALEERLRTAPGLELVDDVAEIAPRALALAGRRVETRRLAEPFSWRAVVERLIEILDELRDEREGSRAGRAAGHAAVATARARRFLTARRGLARRALWRGRPGYLERPGRDAAIERLGDRLPLPAPATPATDVVGLAEQPEGCAVTAAAGFYGLTVETGGSRGVVHAMDRALADHWPLLVAGTDSLSQLLEHRSATLAAFLHRGGTLYVDGLRPAAAPVLAALRDRLRVPFPEVVETRPGTHLVFPPDRPELAHELAGTCLETEWGALALRPGDGGGRPLAFGLAGRDLVPVVVERPVGPGRVVLSTLERALAGGLARAFAGGWPELGRALVPMMLLRSVYGRAAWHPPAVMANFSIDDPALREGPLGLRYDLLQAQARDHGFHVTIATVPREARLAEEAVTRRFRQRPDLLSACYHGCDHDGYEFYLPRARMARYRPRPLAAQRRALRRAVEHGRDLRARRGLELDRVMVFPYGVGPAEVLPDLRQAGFVASCNYGDKYPLGAEVPADEDLGMRPADVAWMGYPLLWRRGLRDQGYLLDVFLGRPVLVFSHARALGSDFRALVERARDVNRAADGAAVWRGLDEVARHAYLQRRHPASGWEVLMTADEACLHNPGPVARSFAVRRPHLPPGSVFEVDGQRVPSSRSLRVSVPPRGTATVRLVAADAGPGLEARRGCSVLPAAGVSRDPATPAPAAFRERPAARA